MNILHIIMLKLLKGATAGIAVVAECNHDFYAFLASIPTDIQATMAENTDVAATMAENTDVRAILPTDSVDLLAAMVKNTDVLAEVC